MKYRVEILPTARREIASLPSKDRKKVDDHIRSLGDEPRPPGAIALRGYRNLFRLRVGRYRIIYEVRDEVLVVMVAKVGHRRDVYRNL